MRLPFALTGAVALTAALLASADPATKPAPATAPADVTLVAQLLSQTAPAADWEQAHPPTDAAGGGAPGPDAPDDELVAYWTGEDRQADRMPAPSPEVRRR